MRVFDSMVYEDERVDKMKVGIESRGDFSLQQSRQVLYLGLVGPVCFSSCIRIMLLHICYFSFY